MKRGSGHFTLVPLYVDDLLVASSNMEILLHTKRKLGTHFMMKDLGRLKVILEVEIFEIDHRISLHTP